MATSIFYDSNAVFISSRREAFVAGTLAASAVGNMVVVTNIHSTAAIVADDFSQIVDANGDTFPNVAACLTYLNAQFTMQRSLDIPSATAVAGMSIAQGMPVAISRANGQMVIARADTYALSFTAGLASQAIAIGFSGSATRNALNLPDWTTVAGSGSLLTGVPYFLAPTGGMTLTVPASPSSTCSVRLGQATDPQTFAFQQADPIIL